MRKEFLINSATDMINLGEQIGNNVFPGAIITMLGDLGAGKTTMTKGIGKSLGVQRTINSPTFTIMKIYEGRLKLYHMDVYRLSEDSGDEYLEEYFNQDGVCVIEWADNMKYLIPEKVLRITITDLGDNQRKVLMEASSSEYEKIIESVNI